MTIEDGKVQTMYVAGVMVGIGIALVFYLIAFVVWKHRPQSRIRFRMWIFDVATPIPQWVSFVLLGTAFIIFTIIGAGL